MSDDKNLQVVDKDSDYKVVPASLSQFNHIGVALVTECGPNERTAREVESRDKLEAARLQAESQERRDQAQLQTQKEMQQVQLASQREITKLQTECDLKKAALVPRHQTYRLIGTMTACVCILGVTVWAMANHPQAWKEILPGGGLLALVPAIVALLTGRKPSP